MTAPAFGSLRAPYLKVAFSFALPTIVFLGALYSVRAFPPPPSFVADGGAVGVGALGVLQDLPAVLAPPHAEHGAGLGRVGGHPRSDVARGVRDRRGDPVL